MSETDAPRDATPPPPPPPVWLALSLAVGLLAGAISGAAVAFLNDSGPGGGSSAAVAGANSGDAVSLAVAKAMPSVVAIINELDATADNPDGGTAGGAGVIIDSRGFILTNAHIVVLPGKLFVILNDGSVRPATAVSNDAPYTDLAVIQVQGGGLRAAALGDSADLLPGQTVIAIGSPDIDYFNSVSVGVVSAVQRRKLLRGVWLEDLIQTDAAINVGNSGGPLLNLNGEVVGINTFRDTGGGDPLYGISFAQSSRTFAPIVQGMVASGKFPRPYFGVEHTDLNDEVAAAKGITQTAGALIVSVTGNSPAAKAGLRAGDIVTDIATIPLSPQLGLLNALEAVGPTDNVDVKILRGGQPQTLKVQLEPR